MRPDLRSSPVTRVSLALALLALLLLGGPARAFQAPAPATTAAGAPAEEGGTTVVIPPREDLAERVEIVSQRRMIFDDNIGYSGGRTLVRYGVYTIEADKMVIDMLSTEAQVEGNVIFRGPDEEIYAEGGRFNFRLQEGVAYGVAGSIKDLYFRAHWNERDRGPSFRRVSEEETIFRGAQFTGCNFPVPHYYVTAKEVIFQPNERVYFRNMTVWVRGVPVFFWPVYSRGFQPSPWSFTAGFSSQIGAYARLGYRYRHRLRTPDWDDPTVYRTRSSGTLDLSADYFFERGPGFDITYRYAFDERRHLGFMQVYGVRDHGRGEVLGEEQEQRDRWIYRHRHNSLIGRTIWQLEVDRASDPDVYADFLDRFAGTLRERGRMLEQRERAAVTYLRRDWVARLSVDRLQRIGRDRYWDPSEPYDDDLDYDLDPNFETDDVLDGINENRYGVVRENVNGRFATNLVRLWALPLYSRTETNTFYTKDPGFNQVDFEDDADIIGSDIYQSLTSRIKLSERYTWTNTVGVGMGYYKRQEDELLPPKYLATPTPLAPGETPAPPDFAKPQVFEDPNGGFFVDGQRFKDPYTVIVGDGTRSVSMRDVEPFYLWADYRSRLNARFTETLEGYLQYTIRQGTEDSLGSFYDQTGWVEARTDVYDFKTDYHWLEGFLNYFLLYPNISVGTRAGLNLQGDEDIFANEMKRYAGVFTDYTNDSKEFKARAAVDFSTRQIRDLSDPNAYESEVLSYSGQLQYIPRHGRWWALLRYDGQIVLEDDPVIAQAEVKEAFNENDNKYTVTGIWGRRLGPKHVIELTGQYDSEIDTWRRFGGIIRRDLHDAEISLFLGIVNNTLQDSQEDLGPGEDDDPNDDQKDTQMDFETRVSFRVKLPGQRSVGGPGTVRTLIDTENDSFFVE